MGEVFEDVQISSADIHNKHDAIRSVSVTRGGKEIALRLKLRTGVVLDSHPGCIKCKVVCCFREEQVDFSSINGNIPGEQTESGCVKDVP